MTPFVCACVRPPALICGQESWKSLTRGDGFRGFMLVSLSKPVANLFVNEQSRFVSWAVVRFRICLDTTAIYHDENDQRICLRGRSLVNPLAPF